MVLSSFNHYVNKNNEVYANTKKFPIASRFWHFKYNKRPYTTDNIREYRKNWNYQYWPRSVSSNPWLYTKHRNSTTVTIIVQWLPRFWIIYFLYSPLIVCSICHVWCRSAERQQPFFRQAMMRSLVGLKSVPLSRIRLIVVDDGFCNVFFKLKMSTSSFILRDDGVGSTTPVIWVRCSYHKMLSRVIDIHNCITLLGHVRQGHFEMFYLFILAKVKFCRNFIW